MPAARKVRPAVRILYTMAGMVQHPTGVAARQDGLDPDHASVKAWMDDWGAQVAAVRLREARNRFSPDVVAFGTHADVVTGLDALVDEQWSQVWPTIEDFAFATDQLHVLVSPDRLQAVAVVPWSSTGIAEDGSRFERPGRATVVLGRRSLQDPWLGVHTHFSLARGVPQRSFGTRTPQ